MKLVTGKDKTVREVYCSYDPSWTDYEHATLEIIESWTDGVLAFNYASNEVCNKPVVAP